MRSRSDNSYVEYYTVEELPLCRIARAMHVLLRMRRPCLSVSNFRIIRPLSARFDSFDSFAMERENAAPRPGKPLANDVKVRSGGRIWGQPKFFSRPPIYIACTHNPEPRPAQPSRLYRLDSRGLPAKRCNQSRAGKSRFSPRKNSNERLIML